MSGADSQMLFPELEGAVLRRWIGDDRCAAGRMG